MITVAKKSRQDETRNECKKIIQGSKLVFNLRKMKEENDRKREEAVLNL